MIWGRIPLRLVMSLLALGAPIGWPRKEKISFQQFPPVFSKPIQIRIKLRNFTCGPVG